MERQKDDYLYWLISKIYVGHEFRYHDLMEFLLNAEFKWSNSMDINRAEDGIDLRTRYTNETSNKLYFQGPCSVLEMMIALAIRCEEHIMVDYDKGDRTGKWFWLMIHNLNLDSMEDNFFDERYVGYTISILLNRKYDRNGENGGMFVISSPRYDMRTADIWYQANWYLAEEEEHE